MNEDVKREWVTALRSGEYTQGYGHLRAEDRFCCLGVLCELAMRQDVPVLTFVDENDVWTYDEREDFLPPRVLEWAGLDESDPNVAVDEELLAAYPEFATMQYWRLASINDTHVPFEDLARLIENSL